MIEDRTVWVVMTRVDTGLRLPDRPNPMTTKDIPGEVCETEVTAQRLAKAQRTPIDTRVVKPMKLLNIREHWYVPIEAIKLIEPTKEDYAEQRAITARLKAVEKAKAAGLTDDDLRALGVTA